MVLYTKVLNDSSFLSTGEVLVSVVTMLGLVLAASCAVASGVKPHVLFALIDDLGHAELG